MDKAFGTRGVGRGEDVGTCGVARVSQLVTEPVNENETFERKVYEGMRTIAV
jgi:hypothetical protein